MSIPKISIEEVVSPLLVKHGLRLVSCQHVQPLWAKYGHIWRLEVMPLSPNGTVKDNSASETVSLILKYITPPVQVETGPLRLTKNIDDAYTRKILSYQVEQYFYTHLAPGLPEEVAVAKCLVSIDEPQQDGGRTTALILTDLTQSSYGQSAFPISIEKRGGLNEAQVSATLAWLAGFHGHFWSRVKDMDRAALVQTPLEEMVHRGELGLVDGRRADTRSAQGVWLNGGYTYLATRRREYWDLASDTDAKWAADFCQPRPSFDDLSLAEVVASILSPNADGAPGLLADYETLIHGDVKSENLFAAATGEQVAFFDFQYVGLGLGVCDLAKLFTCSIPLEILTNEVIDGAAGMDMQPGEMELLVVYLQKLVFVSGKKYSWTTFVRHWELALVDWQRFQASWGAWGNVDWLESRVSWITQDAGFLEWLQSQYTIHKKAGVVTGVGTERLINGQLRTVES